VDRLIEKHPLSTDWIDLLDDAQANALIEILELLKHHPEYYDQTDAFDRATTRIRDRKITNAG
jgi:hypothetical protein